MVIGEDAFHTPISHRYHEVDTNILHVYDLRDVFFPYKAIKSLSRISLTQAGLEALFESNLLDDLKSVMKTNDVVRYRVYEVRLKAYFLMPTIQNAVELPLEGKMACLPCIY